GERWVQAGTANFDESKVESRRAGNGLQVVGDAAVRVQREIPIVKRDSWVLSFGQVRDGVFKSSPEIGISTGASVPSPPRRVHGQLFQVGKPAVLGNPGYLTARQDRKLTQVDRLGALGDQIIVEKTVMADLIVGVVRDVLGHITVEDLERRNIVRGKPGLDRLTVL